MGEGELTTNASDEREERTQQLVYGAIVALTALGLAASAALLVDYLRPMPLFCSESGGCAQLRASQYLHNLRLPAPVFGVGGFFLLPGFSPFFGGVGGGLPLPRATLRAVLVGRLSVCFGSSSPVLRHQ